jgi:hypothetical protein
MKKLATAEEVQAEIKTIWAMTEEPEPSREKLAAALNDLAGRVVQGSLERETIEEGRGSLARVWQKVVDINLSLEGLPDMFRGPMESSPKCMELRALLGKAERPVVELKQLINKAQHILHEWKNEVR